MAAPEPEGKVEITVLKANKLAILGRNPTDDQFYVKLSLGQRLKTKLIRRRLLFTFGVRWNERFEFTFDGEMPNLTLEVFGQETDNKEKDIFIGSAVVSYADIRPSGEPENMIPLGAATSHNLSLSSKDGKAMLNSEQCSTLEISVKIISLEEPIDDLTTVLEETMTSIRTASGALGQLKGPSILGRSLGLDGAAAGSVVKDANSILTAMGQFAEIMDVLSEIHPYAKLAWDILNLSRKVIVAQVKEDASIRYLYEQMDSLLNRIRSFVARLDKLDDFALPDIHKDEKDVLREVSRTSHACARFITDYCKPAFGKRAIKRTFSGGASDTIKDFITQFAFHEKSFNEKIWDGTSLVARQILEKMMADEIAKFIVGSASLLASSHRACFPGTQTDIRKKINDWIDRIDEDVPQVLLLSGMAGTGKSTIAYTIANERAKTHTIYTSFTFNRRAQPPPTARMLFPHVAAFLSALYPGVKRGFVQTQSKEIALGVDLERQLQELIIRPLKQIRLNTSGRIVIVVDGLDEADDDGEQAATLASLLATACKELPHNIRIFVTSRVETYIIEQKWPSAVQRLDMPEASDESLAEVRLFIKDQLKNVPAIGETQYDNLMTTSQGLFQWAATACKEIIGIRVRGGSTPLQRYNMVVASGLGRDKKGLLDSLYEDVLNRAFDPEGRPLLTKVIAALFAMMEPMTLDAFRELYAQLGLGDASDVDCTLAYLPSIMDGIGDRTRLVQPSHTSLRDFLFDSQRSGPFKFSVADLMADTHARAVRGSCSCLLACLRDNTYSSHHLRSYRRRNGYTKSEQDDVQRDTPPAEATYHYACRYWAKHLEKIPTLVEDGILDGTGTLDDLYKEVLKQVCDPDKTPDDTKLLLRRAIAALLAMMEPMTLDVFRELYVKLGLGEESDVDSTLPHLAVILDGINDRTRPVQPNHTSLRGFFLDPKRSGSFCVKDLMTGTHDRAARSSLKILSASLLQVTCTLDFTRRWDREYIVSEGDRVHGEMSHHVEYSTLYFVKHLVEAPTPEEAFWMELGTSLLTDDRALRWIEIFSLLAAHRLRHTNRTPPELSGCMGLLAHIAKRQDPSCPLPVQSAAEHAATILGAAHDLSFRFDLEYTLLRLGEIYESVAWTAKLQRQPEGGPLETIGTGFFLCFGGASHDVILTTAHNVLDTNEHPRTDLVINIPKQVPRLAGASQFRDVYVSVLPTNIHVCPDFSQRQQLDTAWAAILLPRGTVLGSGFCFDLTLKDPGTVVQGTYGQIPWLFDHLHHPSNNSNTSTDVMRTTVLVDLVASGVPISAFDSRYLTPIIRGICNPIYGDNAYTKLTPALIGELGSWLGLPGKFSTRLRWLSDLPDCDDLYLYVNEDVSQGEDSRLYLKRGSRSSFDVSIADSYAEFLLLGFGARVVYILGEDHKSTEKDDEDTGDAANGDGSWLACVSAPDHNSGRELTARMSQSAAVHQQTSLGTMRLRHEDYCFFVKSTLIASPSHADSKLIKISLRDRWSGVKQGETRHDELRFALEG